MFASRMLPYIILISLPIMLSLMLAERTPKVAWFFTLLFYVLFIGSRHEVGADWWQYRYIHDNMNLMELRDVLTQVEPLSHLLFWYSEHLGWHVYGTNYVAALLMMFGVFSFAQRTAYPWVAIVAATPYFVIVMGMSGIRQAMAAGVILFLLSRWEKYTFLRRGLMILVAATFHTSALVNNIFLVAKLAIPLRYKLLIGSIVLLATLYLGTEVSTYSENIIRYKERYMGDQFDVQSFGSLYHIAMIAIPALLGFYWRRSLLQHVHSPALFYFGLYASLAVISINFFSTTVASRLTIYLYFVPMMIYPALIPALGTQSRFSTMFGILAMHIVLLVFWFSLSNHAFTYIPYRSVLWE